MTLALWEIPESTTKSRVNDPRAVPYSHNCSGQHGRHCVTVEFVNLYWTHRGPPSNVPTWENRGRWGNEHGSPIQN
jgi:hypothetical protein